MGEGSYLVITVDIPGNAINGTVDNKEVVLTVSNGEMIGEVVSSTIANATGTIPSDQGMHLIVVNYTESGVTVSSI